MGFAKRSKREMRDLKEKQHRWCAGEMWGCPTGQWGAGCSCRLVFEASVLVGEDDEPVLEIAYALA